VLKTTPLNAYHRAAGARMVDFGGWDMPLHYGSQIEEHHAVRQDAGIFDVSHMQVIDLEGHGVRDFLRGALARDVDRLRAPGEAMYTCMLNERGGIIDDLIVYFFREDRFRLVVNSGTSSKDVAWLRQLQGRPGALGIRSRDDLAILAIQGPKARERFWSAFPRMQEATATLAPFTAALYDEAMVARTGYTGEDGFEMVLPATQAGRAWEALVHAGIRPAGLGARDTLRLEAGMNLYGQDMDEEVSPLDAGLAWTVDLRTPRAFVGREALEARGQRCQFLGLVLLEGGGVLRSHQKVRASGGEGTVTSGTFSPTLARSIALARLPIDARPGDSVHVVVRDKPLPARAVKPPFVRHGKALPT
jgi:aminomethyltransferase